MKKVARNVLLLGLGSLFFLHDPAAAGTSLWKIENGNNTVYLLGSIHLLRESDYPLPPAIESAYDTAQVVVFETHLDSADSPAAQVKFASLGLLAEGATLGEVLSDSSYSLIRLLAVEVGMDIRVIERFKPWAAALILSLQKMSQLGIDPAWGLDRHFFKRAKKENKEILALETIDFQIEMLNTLSEPDQERFLKHTFEEFAHLEQEMPRLIRAWRDGDNDETAELLSAGFDGYPELFERLIKSRNENWMSRLEALMRKHEDVLVVVGLGHLVGEHGLVQQLRARGVPVEQL